MKENIYYKTIELPHIKMTVNFLDMNKLQGIPHTGSAFTVEMEDNTVAVFIQDIEKNVKNIKFIPYIAHEIVHVLQIICKRLQTKIEDESEHTAYIMHYLLDELIND